MPLFVIFFGMSRGMAADNISKHTPDAVRDYKRPLSFEPNQGQTDKQVDFLARGAAYRLFLSHGEATLSLKNSVAVRMQLVGATASSLPEALDPQQGRSNYFIGNVPENWHTNIPNYAKVRYRNVYPGIDLIYYGNQRQLEYDLVVTPGTDPHGITLRFEGAAKTDLDRSGDLVMHTSAGEVRWHRPVAYQELNGSRKLVACNYVRDGEQLSFRLAAYDRNKPLIIDPQLEYSTYLGGSGPSDDGNGITVDARGNAYVTGSTTSADFPTKNAFQSSYLGSFNTTPNAFVSKFDPSGGLVYSTYLGGSGNSSGTEGDVGNGIAVDRQGNAYITGLTGSGDFPTKNAFQATLGGTCQPPPLCYTTNAFVTKLNAGGNALVYSTFLGGQTEVEPQDRGNAIAVDAHDNAYVTGFTNSADFPTKNAFSTLGTAFVTKFDAAGTALVYSTHLGGSGNTQGNGIAVDREGHAYVTGSTTSTDFPTKNAFQKTLKSSAGNAFVTKFDRDGDSLVYSSYLGGSGSRVVFGTEEGDSGNGIAVDERGNAYIAGTTVSSDFPIKNAFQRKLKSEFGNAFVTKFDHDGDSLVYSTFLGGSGNTSTDAGDSGQAIAVDKYGHAYVTGSTASTDFPIKNAFQPTFGGGPTDAFVTKIDAGDCALVYSSYLGGNGIQTDFPFIGDVGNGIGVDEHENAYVTGATSSANFPTKNAFQDKLNSPNGGVNAFVTKISAH